MNCTIARKKLAIAHAIVHDQRHDFLHKISSKLVIENQVIAIETLCVKKMIMNKRLSQSIADAGWATFIRYLEYKCFWYGKELLKADPYFPSSKLCSCCGYKLDDLSLSTREWRCPSCDEVHDRDKNAAKNILMFGLHELGKLEKVPWGARDIKSVELV